MCYDNNSFNKQKPPFLVRLGMALGIYHFTEVNGIVKYETK